MQNTDGFKVSIANTYDNKPLDTLLEKKAENGKDLHLTIDARVQESIYKHMKMTMDLVQHYNQKLEKF